MSTSITRPDARARAVAARVEAGRLHVVLVDGREVLVPTSWFAWLDAATATQQAEVTIIEGGLGLWWEPLDEGLSVPGLLSQPHV